MSSPSSIFILGATGYVGGSLLVSFSKTYPGTTLSALVRSPKGADVVASVGPNVRVVLGSHADLELIKTESSNSEVVIQLSDPDDLALTQAIVSGLKLRQEKTGKRAILLHTTGTATIKDEPTGEITDAYPVWDDINKDLLKSIDISAPHRIVDLEAIKAHEDNIADVYVICPATIYGVGTGPVRRTSIQIPNLVKLFLQSRRAVYVGKGTNIWSDIHVQDLVGVFHFLLAHALEVQKTESEATKRDGFDNFYFATASEHEWGPVLKSIGAAMHKRGLLDTPEVESVPVGSNPLVALFSGGNSRATSTRLKRLGWVPKEKSILDTVDEDVEYSVKIIREKPEVMKSYV